MTEIKRVWAEFRASEDFGVAVVFAALIALLFLVFLWLATMKERAPSAEYLREQAFSEKCRKVCLPNEMLSAYLSKKKCVCDLRFRAEQVEEDK